MPIARGTVCGLLTLTVAVLFLACNDPTDSSTAAKKGPAAHDHSAHDHSADTPSADDHSGHDHDEAHATAGTPSAQTVTTKQTLCPVMDDAIDPSVSVVHDGRKVYFCCKECIDKFKKDPAKYLAKL